MGDDINTTTQNNNFIEPKPGDVIKPSNGAVPAGVPSEQTKMSDVIKPPVEVPQPDPNVSNTPPVPNASVPLPFGQKPGSVPVVPPPEPVVQTPVVPKPRKRGIFKKLMIWIILLVFLSSLGLGVYLFLLSGEMPVIPFFNPPEEPPVENTPEPTVVVTPPPKDTTSLRYLESQYNSMRDDVDVMIEDLEFESELDLRNNQL